MITPEPEPALGDLGHYQCHKIVQAGKITSIKGVQDPLFREFVRRVTHAIIPVGDNEDQGEGDVNVP